MRVQVEAIEEVSDEVVVAVGRLLQLSSTATPPDHTRSPGSLAA